MFLYKAYIYIYVYPYIFSALAFTSSLNEDTGDISELIIVINIQLDNIKNKQT